jgi:hypothetical protein
VTTLKNEHTWLGFEGGDGGVEKEQPPLKTSRSLSFLAVLALRSDGVSRESVEVRVETLTTSPLMSKINVISWLFPGDFL